MNRRLLGLASAFVIGALMALQARVNGELGDRLHDGVAAATISFGSGFLVLALVTIGSPRLRAGVRSTVEAVRSSRLPVWQCLGGLVGAFFVACQGLTVATIGVAVFTVSVVGGQIVSSLWVDRLGIGPGGVEPVTVTRVIGGGLALVAVVIASAAQFGDGPGRWWLAVLPACAGVGLAWQQAVNGRVASAGNPFAATMLNFAVGSVALVAFTSVGLLLRGRLHGFPADPRLYIGGVLGVGVIAAGTLVVRWVGVLLLGLGAVAGQLVGALLLDSFRSDVSVPGSVLLGSGLTLLAVGIAALPSRVVARR